LAVIFLVRSRTPGEITNNCFTSGCIVAAQINDNQPHKPVFERQSFCTD
jgi:hypothetical protein